jgi:hypothetical protein
VHDADEVVGDLYLSHHDRPDTQQLFSDRTRQSSIQDRSSAYYAVD